MWHANPQNCIYVEYKKNYFFMTYFLKKTLDTIFVYFFTTIYQTSVFILFYAIPKYFLQ